MPKIYKSNLNNNDIITDTGSNKTQKQLRGVLQIDCE